MVNFQDITSFGYSQFVEIDLGNAKMIIISGQLSIDEKGNTIGAGDFIQQAEQVFMSIKTILQKANGSFHDVVKLNHYITNISDLKLLKEVRDKFINRNCPPASTTVQISRLFKENLLIEVEATAIIPK